ncbi:MAG: DUF1588 domain-containing protein [Lentisphaeraceae bacterium]|nr:DUF1588 domain-containing protein [Lentisphaeraceae bacterium]
MKFISVLLITSVFISSLYANDYSTLKKILEKRCVDCHDEDMSKGGVRFDRNILNDHQLLEKAFLQVRSGDMPPPKKNKMSSDERLKLLASLAKSIHHVDSKPIRRLTKIEFLNSLSDLLKITIEPSWVAELPEDFTKAEFNTIGNLGFSEIHLKLYLDAVDHMVERALKNIAPVSKKYVSPKFAYFKHPKRPRIKTNGPTTIIKAQPRTAKGLSFPYFREGFKCEEEGYYSISYKAQSKAGASVLVFAGPYHKDGALVNKEPRLLDAAEFKEKRTHTFKVYFKKGNERGFSTLAGKVFEIDNPVTIVGPLTTSWPPKRLTALFPGVKASAKGNKFKLFPQNPRVDLKKVIKHFAEQAFRNKVSADSLLPYYELGQSYLDNNGDFLLAAKETFKAILSSPNFLYHSLSAEQNVTLANRMSYFLWRSTPDAVLLKAAYAGKAESQLDRLLNSPKTERFINDFTTQWLDLNNIKKVGPDFRLYPEFDSFLNHSFAKESTGFMKHLLDKDLAIHNIIDSNFLYINNQLAKLYKIPNVNGPQFRIVKNTTKERGGILTQAGIMMTTADGASTTPVKRGVWLSERILGKTIPQPPKEIAGIEPDLKSKASILQKLDAHRDNKSCRSCHTRIDPYGVAFEAFDPIGQYRDHYRILSKKAKNVIIFKPKGAYIKGARVETAYSMADGREYKDIHDLKKILMEDREMVHRAFVHKLYMFSLARELTPGEILESDQFSKKHLDSGFKTLLKEIILSKLFRGQK